MRAVEMVEKMAEMTAPLLADKTVASKALKLVVLMVAVMVDPMADQTARWRVAVMVDPTADPTVASMAEQ